MRGIAVLLLLSYHAIGSGPANGVEVNYPDALRIFADSFAYVRMPTFAFVSGFVFAIKPPTTDRLGTFVLGKVRRLLVPGAVAAALFLLVADLTDRSFALPLAESWKILVFPYAHYWFLQAIFVILVIYGALDALTGGRALPYAFAGSIALYLSHLAATPNLLSVNQAIYLLPFFLAGALVRRHWTLFIRAQPVLMPLAGLGLLLALMWLISQYRLTGEIPGAQRSTCGLVLALSLLALLVVLLPNISVLDGIGPVSYTIYLYHVFGTSGGRELGRALGIHSTDILVCLSIVGGLAVPSLLYVLARRSSLGRRLIIGRR